MNLMAGSPAETSYEQAQFWHHCLRLMIRYSKSSCESWATELKSLPKTKKKRPSKEGLFFVHLRTQFSNSFYANLEEIYSLKDILYTEGITNKMGLPLVSTDPNDNLILPQGH